MLLKLIASKCLLLEKTIGDVESTLRWNLNRGITKHLQGSSGGGCRDGCRDMLEGLICVLYDALKHGLGLVGPTAPHVMLPCGSSSKFWPRTTTLSVDVAGCDSAWSSKFWERTTTLSVLAGCPDTGGWGVPAILGANDLSVFAGCPLRDQASKNSSCSDARRS